MEERSFLAHVFGYRRPDWQCCNVPTGIDVMRVFFFYVNECHINVHDSAVGVARKLRAEWLDNNRMTMTEVNVVSKVKTVYAEYCRLKKSFRRGGDAFWMKVRALKAKLAEEFDIAARSATSGSCPTKATKRQARVSAGSTKKRRRRVQSHEDDAVSDGEVLPDNKKDGDADFTPPPLVCSSLCQNLDRGKASKRAAFRILAAFAASRGETTPCCSTLRTMRIEARAEDAEAIRRDFQAIFPTFLFLTVHLDGIKVATLDGRPVDGHKKVERLPVIVTGPGVDQMLSAECIKDGTGRSQATAVNGSIQAWGCASKVTSVCTDTTGSMTGCKIGAVVLLEKDLGKLLVYLACRHHLLETIPKHLYDEMVEKSSSPDLGALCENFQAVWDSLNHENFRPTVEDPDQNVLTPEMVSNILNFMRGVLQRKMIRCDYLYLAELVFIYLGEIPPTQPDGIYFHPPIAVSSARFMARIIYSMTIEMFGATGEFSVPSDTLKNLRHLNTFIVIHYLEPWFTATEGISAPLTDLKLLHNIIDYSSSESRLSKIAFDCFKHHLWYLSPHCVGLAFFDQRVSTDTKRDMVKMLATNGGRCRPPLKYPVRKNTSEETLRKLSLPDCVNHQTLYLFEALGLNQDFLELDPEVWEQNSSFKRNQEILKSLQVVNDTAERGVALVKNFNGEITRNEKDFQNLLVVQRKLKSEEREDSLTLEYFFPIKDELE